MTFVDETYLHYSSWAQVRFDAELAKRCTPKSCFIHWEVQAPKDKCWEAFMETLREKYSLK